ncbi:monovalent cation/H(+) antiporter subunit G [Actinospica sp. MGRD01-02]|uniref:Monovalent cation/H(+) antiporter subunit G n=1 Tax=Actinospica acidithermotolerans TaxID=2828514 RepID=A0A941ECM2_9ACTN|nr:monovalent cation/H(+) antiporter subunit G [Actinospica acidithermotolerans]MBR7828003.1 monovalent cation/H(+) antiporter subunit G [Actinospica acidithermotolerans]
MSTVIVVVVAVLALVGLVFSVSGAVGILRMPDVYCRIQCSSKTITMGALPALVALVVGEGFESAYAARALIVAALLLTVNPAASHALARAAYRAGVPMWDGAVRDDVKAMKAAEAEDADHRHGDRPEDRREGEHDD